MKNVSGLTGANVCGFIELWKKGQKDDEFIKLSTTIFHNRTQRMRSFDIINRKIKLIETPATYKIIIKLH